jgi:hypothetical protein
LTTCDRDEYRRRAPWCRREEDFGIAPSSRWLAAGRWWRAPRAATESVADGVTGRLVDEPTVEAFADAMDGLRADAFDSARLRSAAEAFGPHKFDASFRAFLTDTLVSKG